MTVAEPLGKEEISIVFDVKKVRFILFSYFGGGTKIG